MSPFGLLFVVSLAVGVSGQGDPLTVRDSVYSAQQAVRGEMTYAIYCRSCHAADLSGGSHGDDPAPALQSDDFGVNRRDLGNLFSYIRRSMPRDDPGTLTDAMTADVMAFLLRENGFPPGPSDLIADVERLKRIQIVARARR
jgi:mono/diheme cytochrome c family protein